MALPIEPEPVVCDNCASAGEPGTVHSWEYEIDGRLDRIEAKLDAFASMLERFTPLLELAEKRAQRGGRWFGAQNGQGQ